jgi:hypothetical protein
MDRLVVEHERSFPAGCTLGVDDTPQVKKVESSLRTQLLGCLPPTADCGLALSAPPAAEPCRPG